MKRVVDLETVGMVLDSIAEAGYEVAKKRGESLFDVYEEVNDKISFLRTIGVIDEKEAKDLQEYSKKIYRENTAEVEFEDSMKVEF